MAGPVHFILADDPEEAWARAEPHFRYQWDSYRRQMAAGRGMQSPPPIDTEQWRQPGSAGAPPRIGVLRADEAARLLRGWLAGAPVREIFLWASIAGMPDDLVRRHVELVCTRLRDALADA